MADIPTDDSDLEVLRSELKDRVAELEQLFLALEQAVREGKAPIEAVHLILRQAHSLKGSLGMADQPVAAHFVHAMEAAFISIREGKLVVAGEFFDLAFASLDQLSRVGAHRGEDEAALGRLTSKWDAVQGAASNEAAHGHAKLPFRLSGSEAETLRGAVASRHRLYLVEKSVVSEITRDQYDTLPIMEDIAAVGLLVARRPVFADIDRKQRETVLLLLVASPMAAQALADQIFDPTLPVELSDEDRKTYLDAPPPASRPETRAIKSLVVEDDFTSRLMLQKFLAPLGESHVAVDGEEAVAAVKMALEANDPYQLICLDILMPRLDGQAALHALRQIEEAHGFPVGKGTKVIMTTSMKDSRHIMDAFREQCDAYIVKPIERAKLMEQLHRLDLLRP